MCGEDGGRFIDLRASHDCGYLLSYPRVVGGIIWCTYVRRLTLLPQQPYLGASGCGYCSFHSPCGWITRRPIHSDEQETMLATPRIEDIVYIECRTE